MFNDESFISEFTEIVKKLEIKNALEAGFGSGELVTALRETGIDTVGVDKSKALLSVPDGPQFIISALEDFKPENGRKFDLVYSSGVLEHFENGGDVEFIKKMAALTRSKKYILNFVPYSGCLAYKNRKARATGDWKDEADYTPEELAAIHQKAGLLVIETGLAAAQWPKRFGPEPSEPYLAYVIAKKK